jgi:LemA protein
MLIGVLAGLLLIVVVFLIATYNKLVQLRQRVQNAWSQVDVQLKRRYDLIPNLSTRSRAMPSTKKIPWKE